MPSCCLCQRDSAAITTHSIHKTFIYQVNTYKPFTTTIMYFEKAILALGLLPATLLAAPNSSPPSKRATSCTTIYPEYARVSQPQPIESYLPGFLISQASYATAKNDIFIEFNVPPNSYGCQLETYFPPGYPITASGRQDVYLYSTDRPVSRSPKGVDVSWAYSPATVSQVVTTRFESNPITATKKVMSSFTCQEKMTYRLSIGSDYTDAGSVKFAQGGGAGLRMTYDC